MADVVIFGAGDTASVVAFYLDRIGEHRVVGFTADAERLTDKSFAGRPLVAWEDLEKTFPPTSVQLFAPMSYAKLNTVRKQRFLEGRSRGYRFITFIHPDARFYGARIGENCLVTETSFIQPFAEIGDDVMLWQGYVAHHAHVGDHSFITVAMVMAHTTLGERSFVSLSHVSDHLSIGEACVIARGACVTESLPDYTVVVGAASRVLKVPSHRLRGMR